MGSACVPVPGIRAGEHKDHHYKKHRPEEDDRLDIYSRAGALHLAIL